MTFRPELILAFRIVVRVLTELAVPYALIGGAARNLWGTPRSTTDLDFEVLVEAPMLDRLTQVLAQRGLPVYRRHQSSDSGDSLPDLVVVRFGGEAGVRVDLLLSKTPFQQQAVRRAVQVPFQDETCRAITMEDLVVYKLIADRPRDRLDVLDVLGARLRSGGTVDWVHIEHWAAEWGVTDALNRARAQLDDAS